MYERQLLAALLILIVVFLVVRRNTKDRSEGFADPPNLTACPSNLKKFSSEQGIDCCDGEVVGGKCVGTPACTLSEKSGDLPRCSSYQTIKLASDGMNYCPSSLPNYFTKDGEGYCTASPINLKKDGPVNPAADMCTVILSSLERRLADPNSCANKKQLEELVIDITGATNTKFAIKAPPLKRTMIFGATYNEDGVLKQCFDATSIQRMMDADDIHWRSNPTKLQKYKSYNFCKRSDNLAKESLA